MLHYDRIDLSEAIDSAKINSGKQCVVCHYWLFNYRFKFQNYVCTGVDFLMILKVLIIFFYS